jgi:hypothetical protein
LSTVDYFVPRRSDLLLTVSLKRLLVVELLSWEHAGHVDVHGFRRIARDFVKTEYIRKTVRKRLNVSFCACIIIFEVEYDDASLLIRGSCRVTASSRA